MSSRSFPFFFVFIARLAASDRAVGEQDEVSTMVECEGWLAAGDSLDHDGISCTIIRSSELGTLGEELVEALREIPPKSRIDHGDRDGVVGFDRMGSF